MIVGYAEIHLRLDACRSLKDKRHVIHGPIEKARQKFGVSIAEVGDQDLWGNAVIGVACVSSNSVLIEQTIHQALELFESLPEAEVDFVVRDILRT